MTSLAGYARLNLLDNCHSSEARRDLLREVTNALCDGCVADRDPAELDRLLTEIAGEYSAKVRAELAELVARRDGLFACSAQMFARDDIGVARPVLRHGKSLSDSFLMRIAREGSREHRLAITEREVLSEDVSGALVDHGDDGVVASLLRNSGARISDATFELVAERARHNADLHAPLVVRRDVPLELLNDLYLTVEKSLRKQITERLGALTSVDVDEVFRHNRRILNRAYAHAPPDMETAAARIAAMERNGLLTAYALAVLLREGNKSRTALKLGLARMTQVSYELVNGILEGRDLDSIALLCRGAGVDKALFLSLAMSLAAPGDTPEKFAVLYESVAIETARRALRFWRIRKEAEQRA